MGTLGGFPNPPALWRRRAKPVSANAIMGNPDLKHLAPRSGAKRARARRSRGGRGRVCRTRSARRAERSPSTARRVRGCHVSCLKDPGHRPGGGTGRVSSRDGHGLARVTLLPYRGCDPGEVGSGFRDGGCAAGKHGAGLVGPTRFSQHHGQIVVGVVPAG